MKRFLVLILFITGAIGTARFCHHQTKGFRLTKIDQNLPLSSLSPPSPSSAETLLCQKFRYFGRGLQSFVFLSEDGTTVLKLFNNRYQRNVAFYQMLSTLPFCRSWATEKRHLYEEKLSQTFQSYLLAEERLKEETGLLYTHLAQTSHLPSTLILIDPLEIAHSIDPNQYGFVLQKRAAMAYPTLLELIGKQDLATARLRLRSLIQLLLTRCQKGIADKDPLIRTNFGFLGERAIEVDIGPFSQDPSQAHPDVYRPEILRITRSLKNWLNEKEPQLVPILEQELEEQLSSFE